MKLIDLGFTSKFKSLGESGTCELCMTVVGDIIIGSDFQIRKDDVVGENAGKCPTEGAGNSRCSSIRNFCSVGAETMERKAGVRIFLHLILPV